MSERSLIEEILIKSGRPLVALRCTILVRPTKQ